MICSFLICKMVRFQVWVVYWCCLALENVTGEIRCSGDALKRINVSTELQSDVLLPCNFDPALLGSDRTADLSVVWSQINTTVQNLLEITLQGEEKFWDSKDRRIKPFAKLSESGNFSILLTKVQPSDLSLYRCELYNGTFCRTAYQEVRLGAHSISHQAIIITGALIGTVLLCSSIALAFYVNKKRKPRPHPESARDIRNNPIYASYQNLAQLSPSSDEHTYETVQYSAGSRR